MEIQLSWKEEKVYRPKEISCSKFAVVYLPRMDSCAAMQDSKLLVNLKHPSQPSRKYISVVETMSRATALAMVTTKPLFTSIRKLERVC